MYTFSYELLCIWLMFLISYYQIKLNLTEYAEGAYK